MEVWDRHAPERGKMSLYLHPECALPEGKTDPQVQQTHPFRSAYLPLLCFVVLPDLRDSSLPVALEFIRCHTMPLGTLHFVAHAHVEMLILMSLDDSFSFLMILDVGCWLMVDGNGGWQVALCVVGLFR